MLDGAIEFHDDGWTLVEDQLVATASPRAALFTTSNGYVGVRAGRHEPLGGDDAATFLTGVFEARPYAHAERAHAFPESYQTIVHVTDPTPVAIAVDGVPVDPAAGSWVDHGRRLDLRTGLVTTAATWRSPAGARFAVRSRRMASLVEPGLVWLEVEVEPLDGPATVDLAGELRADTADRTYPEEPEALARAWGRVFRPLGVVERDRAVGLVHATGVSRHAVACLVAVGSPGDRDADAGADPRTVEDDVVAVGVEAPAGPGEPAVLTRLVAYADGGEDEHHAVVERAAETLDRWRGVSFDGALARQRTVLDGYWEAATVDVEGAAEVEAAVRFSAFQLFQATRCNPHRAAPAKGLTGQGYEGHQLWDQEIYVGHALTLLAPEAARVALDFRHRTLPEARERARQMGHLGAQFPWRTIDGSEASALFPAGAAQFHLDADIAWAVEHYVACSGDDTFLADAGVEILVETARLWRSIGHHGSDGSFRIEAVTGPDEYTALVDNNLYTNLMAAANLTAAADRLDELAAADPDRHGALVAVLGLDPEEPAAWREAAEAVHVHYDDELGVHGQDDGFLDKARWDLAATPEERFPLQDHHHLLTLYRHQVLKQPDVVLALFLLADRFTPEERRRDFDYYEPLTSHDSSLSAPVHAVVAADVGRLDVAWRYTLDSAFTDLDDRHGTLHDGIHMAAAAGAWFALACGFGGFGMRDGHPSFRPQLPPGIARLRFSIRFRGRLLEVDVGEAGTCYRLRRGDALTVVHDGEPVELAPGGEVLAASRGCGAADPDGPS